MLLLTRYPAITALDTDHSDFLLILPDGREITVRLIESAGHKARLGVLAPADVQIWRREVPPPHRRVRAAE